MKVKRILPMVLSLCMLGGTFAGLAGCTDKGGDGGDNPTPGHQHNYTLWQDNGDGTHSPKCSNSADPECDAPVKTSEKSAHDYGTGTTCVQCSSAKPSGGGDTSTALPADKKIYVVGDSTAHDYTKSSGEHEDKDTYYVVRYGFGTQLHEYLNAQKSQVVNLALSGRSSKSFVTETNYNTLKNSLSAGDYLIIGFGHNDQKQDMAYYTNPNLETSDETTTAGSSFKYTLNEYYLKLAEEKGATPILITPIVRYNKDASKYNNSASGHITETKTDSKTKITYAGGDYAKAIRDLAAEKDVALVDLTAITKQLYTTEGEGALQYHAYRTYKLSTDGTTKTPANPDTTHLNELGAKMVAYQFAQALKTTDCGLKAQVKSLAKAPTAAADFNDKINENYVKPTATPFDPTKKSTLWTNVTEEGWYGTVFGDVGGNDKIKVENFNLSASAGTFTLDCEGQGKFASSTEGMAAIFKQIDATKDFTAEVTATVTDSSADSQTSFGLMLRDDIYIDKYDSSILSNYVSAGVLNGGAVFAMDGEERQTTNGAATIATTSTYTFKIEKRGTSITATVIQDGKTVSHTYTEISLTTSDKNNVYLCMYAVRKIAVSFTNVKVTIA